MHGLPKGKFALFRSLGYWDCQNQVVRSGQKPQYLGDREFPVKNSGTERVQPALHGKRAPSLFVQRSYRSGRSAVQAGIPQTIYITSRANPLNTVKRPDWERAIRAVLKIR